MTWVDVIVWTACTANVLFALVSWRNVLVFRVRMMEMERRKVWFLDQAVNGNCVPAAVVYADLLAPWGYAKQMLDLTKWKHEHFFPGGQFDVEVR